MTNQQQDMCFLEQRFHTVSNGLLHFMMIERRSDIRLGMAKAGPDVSGSEAAAGFVSDNSKITGFSHLHDSGESSIVSMLFYFRLIQVAGTGGVSITKRLVDMY